MDNKQPDYIKENSDNSVTVTLLRGFDVSGENRMSITMREPSVEDALAADQAALGHGPTREVILISNLAEIPPESVRGAKMKDYKRLQQALDFIHG